MRLQRPGAQVAGDVEAGIEVGEVRLAWPAHARGGAQQRRVALAQRGVVWRLDGVHVELVGQLRRIAAQVDQPRRARVRGKRAVGVLHAESRAQPLGVLDEVVEQERERLGDRVVAEVAVLEREPRVDVREVLDVAALVQQRGEVVAPADRRHDEAHVLRDSDRDAEGARRLAGARRDVEVHVALRRGVDPEAGERRLEARQQLRAVERGVRLGEAEEARQVGAHEVLQREAVERALHDRRDERRVRALGRGRERRGRACEAVKVEALQLLAQRAVARPAQLDGGRARALQHLAVERVEVRLGRCEARRLDRRAARAVGLVRLHDRRLAEGDRRSVSLDRQDEPGLALRQLALQVGRDEAEVAVDREVEQHARAAAGILPLRGRGVGLLAQARDRLAREQLGVLRIDRLDVELRSEAGEVRVVLLAQLGRERLGLQSVRGEVHGPGMLVAACPPH